VKHRGTTIDEHPFVDLYGKPGDYQDELKVYAREGEPCRRCRAPIAKARFSNKPLYYCEACQV
jgi:formamidopyrimidine-DNA glycosylase